jgi:hypothetical protein
MSLVRRERRHEFLAGRLVKGRSWGELACGGGALRLVRSATVVAATARSNATSGHEPRSLAVACGARTESTDSDAVASVAANSALDVGAALTAGVPAGAGGGSSAIVRRSLISAAAMNRYPRRGSVSIYVG